MIRELRALGIKVQEPNIQEPIEIQVQTNNTNTHTIQNTNNTIATATTAI